MAKRRANSEGNIYQRADGRWEGRLSYIDPATGSRKRVSAYGATQKAVLAELGKIRDRLEEGKPPKDATTTIEAWLKHWRETTLAASDRKPATRELYSNLSRKHLEPAPFGMMSLDRLRPAHIEKLILDMRAKTRTRGRGEDAEQIRAFSDSTIRSAYAVLRQALDGAVRDGLLGRNPAALVKRPGVERVEARHLDTATVADLLAAAEGLRYAPVLKLIASTGIRRGEALGLTWDRVDLDAGFFRVAATMSRVGGKLESSDPKTERSRRTIPLSPAMVAMLRTHRKKQIEERVRAANVWNDRNLVFATEAGHFVEPRNILRTIEIASAKAGLEGVGVHTLRHSAAVAWLENGIHIRQVADLLGHSSIAITGDVYGHGSDEGAKAAVLALEERLGL
ncbi:site-specific integrase [Mycobacterium paragordonae]|uniref:Site-specific integrase n=1 Tax=Mycobacterium paragordonae TaxID=1389713 RepID=A0ABQ1C408_9MYCO|nr:site-specific integrase [Mycobacterium paragordonae]AYE95810.1 site-specific integrase [Mycobacterium paragordonae]GFG79099.1 site-specific integrase [Mycobacterium paragordonae]